MRYCEGKESKLTDFARKKKLFLAEQRIQRARQRRCFWSFPLGHCWHESVEGNDILARAYYCCGCRKYRKKKS